MKVRGVKVAEKKDRTREEQVLRALRRVEDPDLKKDLVSLGMIKELKVGKTISFAIELTTPACPLKKVMEDACVKEIRSALGTETKIDIRFSAQVPKHGRSKVSSLPQVKHMLAIASGKGGVGKSTLSVNLAIALHLTGAKVGLVDADIFGPSIPLMLHCQDEKPQVTQQNGKHFLLPIERYGIQVMSMGMLVSPEQAVVWRGPMASSALKQLVSDSQWQPLDYLLIDLPPGTSDIPLTLAQAFPLTGVIITTTPQQVAISDVRKGVSMFRKPEINIPIIGLVQNMAYFTPPELPDKRYYLFGKGGGEQFAKEEKIPFLGEVPIVPEIQSGSDNGYPIGLKKEDPIAHTFQEIAGKVAQQISILNLSETFHKTQTAQA